MPSTSLRDRPAGIVEDRIADAALRCVGRWGLTKTTVDDIAREAGCSRATVYRAFTGGKGQLMAATMRRELQRFFASATARFDAAATLEDLLVAGTTEAARFVGGHEAIQYLLAHEPNTVMTQLAVDRAGVIFRAAGECAAPHLLRFVRDADVAVAAGEWVARVVLSYTFWPSPGLDLTVDDDARRLVRAFLLPALDSGANP